MNTIFSVQYKGVIFMKLKKLITTILTIAILTMPMLAFASAETLPAGYAGNSDALIDIKNPEAAVTSTTSKICVVSAVAVSGTTVTLYTYDNASGKYVKMYSDGKALESVVGAAGLYAQSVELKSGANTILVVANSGDATETIKLDITLLKNDFAESLRSIWQTLINY